MSSESQRTSFWALVECAQSSPSLVVCAVSESRAEGRAEFGERTLRSYGFCFLPHALVGDKDASLCLQVEELHQLIRNRGQRGQADISGNMAGKPGFSMIHTLRCRNSHRD